MKLNTNWLMLLMLILLSCTMRKPHTNDEIEQAMNNYDSLILKQNPGDIANVFTQDGQLGNAAAGRDSIKIFLEHITNFKVIEQSSTTTNIQIRGDSALQTGTYLQRDIDLQKRDTLKAMGTFTCKWKWLEGEGWKIRHIVTTPF